MKRILFVDDESQVLDGIRRLLRTERSRWEMHFALGGEAALAACEAAPFDVVVSDMRMPGMDGATLLGQMMTRYPGTARLILSGYAEAELAARAAPVAYRSLSKPCTPEQLRETIERVCTLQDVLCTTELRQMIGAIGELPSLSSTYMQLATAVQDPDIHIAAIAAIISQDAAMSAKILQLTNSAFFGLAQRVRSLQSAVGFLGMNTIRNLALVSDTFRVLKPDKRIPRQFFEALQQHVHRTALIAGALPVATEDRDATVIAALLHDIGRLVLASKAPESFCAAAAYAEEHGCSGWEAEKSLLGISHAEIGAYLLGLWGIDPMVVEAIAHHHEPTRISHATFDSSIAVYLADVLEPSFMTDATDDVPTRLHPTDLAPADLAQIEALGLHRRISEFRLHAAEALSRQRF